MIKKMLTVEIICCILIIIMIKNIQGGIMLDINRTAAFDVDVQNGFTPACPEELPVPEGDEIAHALNEQAKYAKFRVGSKDAHCTNAAWIATDDKPQFTNLGLPNADIYWNEHCIMGTKGAELIDNLPAVTEYDFFVWKGIEPDLHPYGACFHDLEEKLSTGVIEFLKMKEVENVIVGGLATDYCVKNTALQLKRAGFNVVINLEACRGIANETIATAIEEMKEAGIEIIDNIKTLN